MLKQRIDSMATAKTAIKESLLGATLEPEISSQSKATFDRNSRQDEETEERYMSEEDFVNAVAPASEDYVGCWIFSLLCPIMGVPLAS